MIRFLASRTRKARRETACVLCRSRIMTGQQIGLLAAGWAHTRCIVTNRTAP